MRGTASKLLSSLLATRLKLAGLRDGIRLASCTGEPARSNPPLALGDSVVPPFCFPSVHLQEGPTSAQVDNQCRISLRVSGYRFSFSRLIAHFLIGQIRQCCTSRGQSRGSIYLVQFQHDILYLQRTQLYAKPQGTRLSINWRVRTSSSTIAHPLLCFTRVLLGCWVRLDPAIMCFHVDKISFLTSSFSHSSLS